MKFWEILVAANKSGEKVRERYLYVLALEDGCFYVGSTQNPKRRFRQHRDGQAASWTRLHRPIQLLECYAAGTSEQSVCERLETAKAVELMQLHGIKKVRGGAISYTDDDMAARQYIAAVRGRLFRHTGGLPSL